LTLEWGQRMAVPEAELARWLKAVWLHDALRDASDEELVRWAPASPGMPGSLRHGPAAASRAKAEGETDRGVLDAVRYHSVGSAEWDMVGRVLYCADFLEPGRTFEAEKRAALAARFPSDPVAVLLEVARWRIGHLIQSGWTLPEPSYRFWNSQVRAGAAGSR
jgi:2-amino-4-hydroxy-6-hydroxymethyldihydropteridine diphosphokinase